MAVKQSKQRALPALDVAHPRTNAPGGPSIRHLLVLLGMVALVASAAPVLGESAQSGDSLPDLPAIGFLQGRLEELAASPELDEATRTTLGEYYRQALQSLQLAAGHRESIHGFQNAIETASNEAARVRTALDGAIPTVATDLPPVDDLSLPELERRLQMEAANLAAARARIAEIETQIEREKERPSAIRARLREISSQTAALASVVAAPSAPEELSELAEARRWALEAQMEALRTETLMLQQELSSQPMRLDLWNAQRDQAQAHLDTLETRVEFLGRTANKRRREEAENAKLEAQVAEREAAGKHPVIADLAGRNTGLTEDIDQLAGALDGIQKEAIQVTEEAARIEESFSLTRQKLSVAGSSPVLGHALLEQQRSLPDLGLFRRQMKDRQDTIAEVSLAQIQLEEEQRRLRNPTDYIAALAAEASEVDRPSLLSELTDLANSRRELVDKALAVQRTYLRAVAELDSAQRRLFDVVQEFDHYLDKRLLWVPSTDGFRLETLRQVPGQLVRFLHPEPWRCLAVTLFQTARSAWFGLALLVALGIAAARGTLAAGLRDSSKNVGKVRLDRLTDTLRGLGMIALLALPWPLLLLVTGWELRTAHDADDFIRRFGTGLMRMAPLLFQLAALRWAMAPGSVATDHFGWRERGVHRLYRDLTWFIPLVVGFGLVTILTLGSPDAATRSGLGRVSYVLLMATMAWFFFRLAKPAGGALSLMVAEPPAERPLRWGTLWFLLLVGPPLASAGLSLAGYLYTSGILIDHILDSVLLALLLIVVRQLIVRLLTINQRRLRLEAALAKRKAELEERKAKESLRQDEAALAREVEEPEIDIEALDATSQKLCHNVLLLVGLLGLGAIWQNVLPALQILDDVTLWTYTRSGTEKEVPVTLLSLGLALLVLVITVVATRQLPAFLEMVLLQRTKMSRGSRYTALTLTRYAVIAVGTIWIFGFLGGSWSEIQWIIAALGVGIGFGLQEIVANFVSGLIILFERPIRVGDVVTIGATDGVVTRIHIRATTIRNWDGKELLVPNKNFITQELLNWSLSDQTTRIVLPVGVAYGSDPKKAMAIMQQTASDHHRILADPAPFVVFEEFGDNALLLSLRCYIADIEYRLSTITDLHLAINQGLTEAGIVIAFPQRDVHLDSTDPIEVRLHRDPPTDRS